MEEKLTDGIGAAPRHRPAASRPRADEFLKRKLIRKVLARRGLPSAHLTPLSRRLP